MPPNLGGFFMVRSYYPSECHADYFDFERIEALKPAIEACGISTLSQSPMLGLDRKSGSAGMPRPKSYAVFCLKKTTLPALTAKLSKYHVDDLALGVCKTRAEQAGVIEVRTSLS